MANPENLDYRVPNIEWKANSKGQRSLSAEDFFSQNNRREEVLEHLRHGVDYEKPPIKLKTIEKERQEVIDAGPQRVYSARTRRVK